MASNSSDGLFKAMFDASGDALLVVDHEGVIRFANERAHELFGWSALVLAGQPIEILVPEVLRDAHRALRSEYTERPARRMMGAGLELSGRRCDGSEFPADVGLSPFQWQGQRLILASVRDESERRRAESETRRTLATLVERDPLTWLPNRHALDEGLARATARANASVRPLALIVGDVDHLARVNALCGQSVGDEVLRRIARTLEAGMRESDLVCRHGAGKFAIVMPGADLERACQRAEAIARRIRAVPPPTEYAEAGPVTLSFGIAAAPEHGTTAIELLEHAERALSRAKADGRDCMRTPSASDEDGHAWGGRETSVR